MPLPTPKKDETKKEFESRCMSDDKMNQEYPDSGQRFAVCSQRWNSNKNKEKSSVLAKLGQNLVKRLNNG